MPMKALTYFELGTMEGIEGIKSFKIRYDKTTMSKSRYLC
jgi:hypothetical protein